MPDAAEHSGQYDVRACPWLELDSPITALEWVKMVVLMPLGLFRMLMVFLIWLVVAASGELACLGLPENEPLTGWRNGEAPSQLGDIFDLFFRSSLLMERFPTVYSSHVSFYVITTVSICFGHCFSLVYFLCYFCHVCFVPFSISKLSMVCDFVFFVAISVFHFLEQGCDADRKFRVLYISSLHFFMI